jgi:UDP-glucose 4-epimerase
MRITGRSVLVTGGAGFIGSHLVDKLTDCRVRVLDDLSTGKLENLAHHRGHGNVEFVEGSVVDRGLLDRLLVGVDVVFHLACRGVRHSLGNPQENHEVNATGTLVVLEAARRAGVQRFVHVSSSEVYGTAQYAPIDESHPTQPETVYGAAKLAGDCYARAYYRSYRFPSIVVRPFNNFGPRSHYEGDCGEVIPRFAVWALNGKPPVIFGDGLQTRDFIYVEETAYWLRRAAECDELIGSTVNIGSGEETSVRALAELVYDIVGNGRAVPDFQPPRPGDVRRLLADVTLARSILGLETRVKLRDGVGKLVEHLRAQGEDVHSLLGQVQQVNWSTA